ncbi:MAG: DUF177 domain-containing protein [Clostridia bacterium]|nr:DUF177 domain-containing protein [Deltaproteobacteria bacterium]
MASSPLKVPIDKIGPDGYELDVRLEKPWMTALLSDAKAPFEPVDAGELDVRLDRAGDVVHIRGSLSVHFKAACGRCLRTLTYDIEVPVEVAMFPDGSALAAGNDSELDQEDLGASTYENKEIDLEGLVRDEIFLEMPMNPMCEGEAAATCVAVIPVDAQLDKGTKQDPRWEALTKIKLS